ncbi:MAG: hypothetical protein SH819_09315 [Cytophagales bacterium]|nr:hypothetical protein [Cytophagales bacterium]
MVELDLEGNRLVFSIENSSVRVKSSFENVLLVNQTVDAVTEIVRKNFAIVSSYYVQVAYQKANRVGHKDITVVSISILLHYLYMYNSWRNLYKRMEKKSLKFRHQDFESADTWDAVVAHFRKNYPDTWREMCSILLKRSEAEIEAYCLEREKFFNR